jgi:nicotinic acid mononucleotide adenylyltransferase
MSSIQASAGGWAPILEAVKPPAGPDFSGDTAAAKRPFFDSLTRAIEVAMLPELACMAKLLGKSSRQKPLLEIHSQVKGILQGIENLISGGVIRPWQRLRLSIDDPEPPSSQGPLRLGVYPITGNPMHWGHLLAGLSAMIRIKLDKVVFVIAGSDPRKGDLLPEDVRHESVCSLLRNFDPLLCYSPIARGTVRDGESNLFHLLSLNHGRRIDAFYIAGTDHCYRRNPVSGEADTVQKLETGVMRRVRDDGEQRASAAHTLSVIFIQRERRCRAPDTFLPLRFIPSPLPEVSSTDIRDALCGRRNASALAALPFTVFQHLQGVKKTNN